jgi:hypothetical protein
MHIQYIMEDAMAHNTEDFVADSSVAAGQG